MTPILEFLLEADRQLFLFLNGLHNDWLDVVMFHISEKTTWIPLYVLLLVLTTIRYKWKGLLFFVILAIFLVLFTDQASVWLKNTVMRLRPCHEAELEGLIHLVNNRCGGRFSFVSSHATNTFGVAVFAIQVLKNRFRFMMPTMLAYASLNAYSRIYLGVHYPGDVIFGALLGSGIGFFISYIWIRLASKYLPPPEPDSHTSV